MSTALQQADRRGTRGSHGGEGRGQLTEGRVQTGPGPQGILDHKGKEDRGGRTWWSQGLRTGPRKGAAGSCSSRVTGYSAVTPPAICAWRSPLFSVCRAIPFLCLPVQGLGTHGTDPSLQSPSQAPQLQFPQLQGPSPSDEETVGWEGVGPGGRPGCPAAVCAHPWPAFSQQLPPVPHPSLPLS